MRSMVRLNIQPGDIFGFLTVMEEAPKRGRDRAFRLRCACGGETVVLLNNLRAGRQISCGCKRSRPTHGMWRTPTYNSWAHLYNRCLNPKHERFCDYGARGISIDPRWRSFANFLADMGERAPGTEIDRIDNNGNYTPGNCRWATRAENLRNTRRTRRVVIDGASMCLTDAAKILGVPATTIAAHAQRKGLAFQEAVDHYISRRITTARA